MAVTGVQDLRFLNYRDSGMAGTDANQHPNALMQASPDEVIGRLVDVMRETRPQVVITHDPTGGYGHPDHVTVCRHVTAAFGMSGKEDAYPDQLAGGRQPWQPALLYYVCFPRSFFRRMWQYLREAGIRPPFASEEVEALGTPDDEGDDGYRRRALSRHQDRLAELPSHADRLRKDPSTNCPPIGCMI